MNQQEDLIEAYKRFFLEAFEVKLTPEQMDHVIDFCKKEGMIRAVHDSLRSKGIPFERVRW